MQFQKNSPVIPMHLSPFFRILPLPVLLQALSSRLLLTQWAASPGRPLSKWVGRGWGSQLSQAGGN